MKLETIRLLQQKCIDTMNHSAERLASLKEREARLLSAKAREFGSPLMALVGMAIRHGMLGEKPESATLGRDLAKELMDRRGYVIGAELELMDNIRDVFDIEMYVLSNSHYDCCDNGVFYRRS